MLKRVASLLTAAGFLAASLGPPAVACTGISLLSGDGAVIRGRTLEFGAPVQSKVMVVPAGLRMTGTLPDGGTGLVYETKHASVGANMLGLVGYLDGVNDAGLSLGLFYFPGYAGYAEATTGNAARALAPHEFTVWLLSSFATVEEVRAGLADVVIVATKTPGLGSAEGTVAPAHIFLRDRSGRSIVIEPIDGGLRVHDAPLGVVTNAPTYDWHMTNLKTYINLTTRDVEKGAVAGTELTALSSSAGLVGLPGDFTSPSRFVRAAIFAANAAPTKTATDTVLQAFHILNQFDIPEGSVQNSAVGTAVDEVTEWTSVADLTNLRWYFRTRSDQSIRMVDLAAAVAAAAGRIVEIPMESEQPILDVSADVTAKAVATD
jgi:choloylglycine hydrolase